MEKFSAAFESAPVTGATALTYGPVERSLSWTDATELTAQLPWADGRENLRLTQNGTGRPWATVRATPALPLKAPLSTGFKIERSVVAVEQAQPGRWTRGDVARVRLTIDAQADMTWVVIDDPIPSGASILGSGLGGQSATLTRDERSIGFAWLAFEQRAFDAGIQPHRQKAVHGPEDANGEEDRTPEDPAPRRVRPGPSPEQHDPSPDCSQSPQDRADGEGDQVKLKGEESCADDDEGDTGERSATVHGFSGCVVLCGPRQRLFCRDN
jgi:hypothetical protein